LICLIERFELTRNSINKANALHAAAVNGRLLVMQHLVQKFELTADNTSALCSAAESGQSPMMQYLAERFKMTVVELRYLFGRRAWTFTCGTVVVGAFSIDDRESQHRLCSLPG
jgi:hypothetical protein